MKGNLLGKWGAIPLTHIKSRTLDNYIHPYDIVNINHQLNLETSIIRIKPLIVQETPKPDFFINDKVKTVNSKTFRVRDN